MSRRIKKLSPRLLRKMIVEEATKIRKEVLEPGGEDVEKVAAKTDEVDADEFAETIEQDIDWMRALKIHERRLMKKLQEVKKAKKRISVRLAKKV